MSIIKINFNIKYRFLNEKQVPLSRLREMTPEPTYSLYDALPPSRKVSADRITRDTPQRLVKSDTGSYSSLDLLAYQSSPISGNTMYLTRGWLRNFFPFILHELWEASLFVNTKLWN